jgi:hypothetical protein
LLEKGGQRDSPKKPSIFGHNVISKVKEEYVLIAMGPDFGFLLGNPTHIANSGRTYKNIL